MGKQAKKKTLPGEPVVERCKVCNSTSHVHCSKGCSACDDPESPVPTFAVGFCPHCGDSFCRDCLEEHECGELVN